MNQNERDTIVDRYLTGTLSSAEESDFFLAVAVDPELQRTLKSFQIMDRVIARDRDSVPAQGRYREHVMGMLAASHVIAGGGAAVSALAEANAGAAASGLVRTQQLG